MTKLFETVRNIPKHCDVIARRPYGVIEVTEGRFEAIHLRPWPKIISVVEANWLGGWQHGRWKKDQCLLYYNQPMGHPNFLALKYTVSSLGTTYKTFRRTLQVLDEVARIKQTDAIVAEVTNHRLSDRFMKRMGWEQHLLHKKGRHYIKRFYGEFPPQPIASAIWQSHSVASPTR